MGQCFGVPASLQLQIYPFSLIEQKFFYIWIMDDLRNLRIRILNLRHISDIECTLLLSELERAEQRVRLLTKPVANRLPKIEDPPYPPGWARE
jgi:hypothetical protein